jgi:hypothetical protein
MSEAGATLRQRASELSTAVAETRSELARLDEDQRSEAHRQLLAACNEAAEWLERLGDPAQDRPAGEAASLAQEAQAYLLDLRTKRNAT